jgi:O-antigen ligase
LNGFSLSPAIPLDPDEAPWFQRILRFLDRWQIPGFILFAAGLAFSISFTNYAIFIFVLLPLLIRVDFERRVRLYRTPLDFPFLALYASMILSSASAYLVGGVDFGNRSFLWTVTYTAPVVFYTVCFALPAHSPKLWGYMAAALFLAAAAHSGVALYQFIRTALAGEDLYTVRPSGRMFYMTFGGVIALIVTFSVAIWIKARMKLKWRLALAGLILIMLGGLAACLVRSAWVSLAVAIFVIAVVADKRLLWTFPIVALAVAIAAPRPILKRAESIINAAKGEAGPEGPPEFRVDIWRTSLRIARDYPLTGVGLHNTIKLYDRYKDPDAIESQVPHAHNNYIQLVVERGILGFLVFAYFIYALFALFIKGYRRARAPTARAVNLAGIGVMSGFMVGGFFEYTFGDYEIMAIIYALAAAATVIGRREDQEAALSTP